MCGVTHGGRCLMWTIDAHQSCFIPSICVVDVDRLKAHLFSDDRRTLDLFEAGIFRLSRWALAVESLPVDAAVQTRRSVDSRIVHAAAQAARTLGVAMQCDVASDSRFLNLELPLLFLSPSQAPICTHHICT